MRTDRRLHERRERLEHFKCTIDGQAVTLQSINLSHGGALVRAEDEIRLGAVVLIVPDREMKKKLPVALAGLVVRKQADVRPTYGIQWQKCVTKDGIQRLYDFLAFYLNLYPASLPLPSPVAYGADHVEFDFRFNEFRAVD